MPLGIEGNSAVAGIIERGGDAIAQDLSKLGQTIETSLIRQQAFRQARDLGAAISQVNPQSPDWPQRAAAITSQYPLAVQSGLAEHILKPLAMSYQGYEAMRRVTAQGVNALDRAKYIHSGAAGTPMVNVGGSPELPAPNLNPPAEADPAVQAGLLTARMAGIAPVIEEQTMVPEAMNKMGIQAGIGRRPVLPQPDQLAGMTGTLADNAPLTPMERAKQVLAGAPGGQVTRRTLESVAARIAGAEATAANRAVKPVVEAQWKPNGAGIFYRTKADGSLEFKSFDELGIDAKKGMTDYQREHLDEMRDRIKKSGITRQINSLESDLAKLHGSIEAVQKDPTRREELLPLQKELVAVKEKRDQLLQAIGADASEVFDTEEAARAAGKQTGDIVILINPKTGKPAKARLD